MLAKLDADTLKNILSFATAFANKVLPVPGGPKSKIPFIAFLIPLKKSGIIRGSKTASCSKFFAFSNYAISSKLTWDLYVISF